MRMGALTELSLSIAPPLSLFLSSLSHYNGSTHAIARTSCACAQTLIHVAYVVCLHRPQHVPHESLCSFLCYNKKNIEVTRLTRQQLCSNCTTPTQILLTISTDHKGCSMCVNAITHCCFDSHQPLNYQLKYRSLDNQFARRRVPHFLAVVGVYLD